MEFVGVYLFLQLFIAINEGNADFHTVVQSTLSELRLKTHQRKPTSAIYTNDNNLCYRNNFVKSQPPTGFAKAGGTMKYICQHLNDDRTTTYFATMFNESAGIPVYSAYVVRSAEAKKINPEIRKTAAIKEVWRTEPGQWYFTGLKAGQVRNNFPLSISPATATTTTIQQRLNLQKQTLSHRSTTQSKK